MAKFLNTSATNYFLEEDHQNGQGPAQPTTTLRLIPAPVNS